MRIGVFGGTFDPIHLGHLILAEQCREQARLDRVLFVPAARPPHKDQRDITPFGQRVEMVHLAIAGHAAFAIDELEKDRAGPSYTVHTLAALHGKFPQAELFLLVGSDTLQELAGWYQPLEVVKQAGLVVTTRPGSEVPPVEELRGRFRLPAEVPLRLEVVQVPLLEIASTDLRQRVREGRSIRYYVPRAVEVYIAERHLYQ